MRTAILIAGAFLLAAPVFAQPAPAGSTWQLVWSDEFNGPAGSLPNPAYWTYDLGTDCCGNDELETYTNSTANVHLDGQGHLDIHIENPSPGVYTSARIKTEGLISFQYGLVEASIKIPSGQGMWPAFWMLGTDITSVGWPNCGEIDIMENIGSTPATAYGSLHGPYSYNETAQYQLSSGALADDFHTYAVVWSANQITFYVDGNLYETQTDTGPGWVFNQVNNPFFIILNAAVGGTWPGSPNSTTQFPQDMLVDYVRVYQASDVPAPAINTGGVVDAATGGPALAPGSLASIFGQNLSAVTQNSTFDTSANAFPKSLSGVQVLVNGAASPLLYLSPSQINFAIPWDSPVGAPLNVELTLNSVESNPVPITLTSTAPSAFGQVYPTPGPYYSVNMAIMECSNQEAYPQPGAVCTLWGNGFGLTNPPQTDGAPAPGSPLPRTVNSCSLTVGGVPATVTYCGAAPGEIIDQLNFIYPSGVTSPICPVAATITINGNSGGISVFPPKACGGP
jgi:uncharacterized protein (TIGR03437 family)